MPWSQLPQHPSIRTRRDDDVLCAMCFLGKKVGRNFQISIFKNKLQIFFLGDKNLAMKLGRGRENFFPTDFSVAKHGPNNFLKTNGFGGQASWWGCTTKKQGNPWPFPMDFPAIHPKWASTGYEGSESHWEKSTRCGWGGRTKIQSQFGNFVLTAFLLANSNLNPSRYAEMFLGKMIVASFWLARAFDGDFAGAIQGHNRGFQRGIQGWNQWV